MLFVQRVKGTHLCTETRLSPHLPTLPLVWPPDRIAAPQQALSIEPRKVSRTATVYAVFAIE
jgi:hypothetical protein